jgi:glycosyltransferase involved in cell wall biosynthesis
MHIREYGGLETPVLRRLAVARIARDCALPRPDLLHVQTRGMAHVGAMLAAALGLPYVLTVHDFPEAGCRFTYDPVHGRRIIAVSEAVRSCLVSENQVPSSWIEVLHSGVRCPPWRPTAWPHDRTLVVGTAAPLEPVKGLPFFLQAIRRVRSSDYRIEFVVAGSGPDEVGLRRLARELGVADRVTFATHVRDYADVLDAFDIFVLPSLRQGLGTVMLEAMAMGKPVIATQVGGVEEVVQPGATGLLVPPGNADALAEAIVRLLDDPPFAMRLAEAAYRLVSQHYNVDRMARCTAAVYRQAIAPAPKSDAANP